MRSSFVVSEVPAPVTRVAGVSIRLLAPDQALRLRGGRRRFARTEPGNGPANALYRGAGGFTDSVTVQWEFLYDDR